MKLNPGSEKSQFRTRQFRVNVGFNPSSLTFFTPNCCPKSRFANVFYLQCSRRKNPKVNKRNSSSSSDLVILRANYVFIENWNKMIEPYCLKLKKSIFFQSNVSMASLFIMALTSCSLPEKHVSEYRQPLPALYSIKPFLAHHGKSIIWNVLQNVLRM